MNWGINDYNLYTTKEYLTGGYIGDDAIISEEHTEFDKPGTIANNVTATELFYERHNSCLADDNYRSEIWGLTALLF